ncbi:putative Pentatricopeptide repeat domain containing protein [Klebsormidium nitens]|uniref:Putative Pentatricopeptide repeat domain containing protein n=1 Tax=Klebsormidium nitens TaxID=105231 RepID=A0A0U9HT09_KLENI|nr:putative Pentatricopeptide repeat domain containing protein [Klebsormidium nitens]|eukprot:GAQ88274.1 putative Pentatricopeptide repeat domain containing protein [Klebsormidium nitens]
MSNTASFSGASQACLALCGSDGRGGRTSGRELNGAAHIVPSCHASAKATTPSAGHISAEVERRLVWGSAGFPNWDSNPFRRKTGLGEFGEKFGVGAEGLGRGGRKLLCARSLQNDRRSPWDSDEGGGPGAGSQEQQAAGRGRSGSFEGGYQSQERRVGGREYRTSDVERTSRGVQRKEYDTGRNGGFQDFESGRDSRGPRRGGYGDERYPSRGGGEGVTREGGGFGQRYERNAAYEGSSRGEGSGEGRRGGRGRGRGGSQRRGYDRRDVINAEEVETRGQDVWTRGGGRQYVQRGPAPTRMRADDALEALKIGRGQPISDVLEGWGARLSMPEWNRLLRLVESVLGIQAAVQVVDWMKTQRDCPPNTIIYTTLLGLLGKNRLSSLASKALDEMAASGVAPDIKCYNSAISAQVGAQAFESATEIVQKLKADRSVRATEVTYNALLNTGVKSRVEPQRLRDLLSEMREARLKPNNRTYTSLISAFAKAGDFDSAFSLLKEMRSEGADPDTITYNVLIDSLGPAGRAAEADALVQEMIQQGLQPSMSTYSILMKMHGRNKEWEQMEGAFRSMQQAGIEPDVIVYGTLMDAFGRAGEWERAEKYFEEMQSAGLPGNAAVFNGLIMGYGKSNQADKAKALLHRMSRAGVAPTIVTYNAVLDAFANEKRVEDMEAVFRNLLLGEHVPNLITWNTLLKGYGEAQRMKPLDDTLRKMTLAGVEPDTVSWSTIAMAYERAGIKKVAAMAWERAGPRGTRQKVPPRVAALAEIDEIASAMAQAIETPVESAHQKV